MTPNQLPEHRKISPPPIQPNLSISELIDNTFQGYNAARLREACSLFASEYCNSNTLIGMSVAGALTPIGLGPSCLVPLIKNGWVDWIVSTGANIYHDMHFALGYPLYRGSPCVDDCDLHRRKIVRIYDVLFEEKVLLKTDSYVRDICRSFNFSEPIGTARLHYEIGSRLLADFPERAELSFVATAAQYKVPVYVSSPGDSSTGMDLARLAAEGHRIIIDPSIDVNETAGLVYWAQSRQMNSGVLLLGGGSPKNFILQTEPYLRDILELDVKGHDYFIQFTDARPDTGGLSGATPSEAVSWGKIKEEQLPDSIVCYADTSLCLPLLVAYACQNAQPVKPTAAYDFRLQTVEQMIRDTKTK